jgi:hypothetical protein
MSTQEIDKWCILRLRTMNDELEYRILGSEFGAGWVILSNVLSEFDKSEGEGKTIDSVGRPVGEVIVHGPSVPYKDNPHFEAMQSYVNGRYKSVTDMTEMITQRTFLPPSMYQTQATKDAQAEEAAKKVDEIEGKETKAEVKADSKKVKLKKAA